MWSEPVIRAPFSGLDSANSSRVAIRPGISCSARRISLRPNSASERSATLKSRPVGGRVRGGGAHAVIGLLGRGSARPKATVYADTDGRGHAGSQRRTVIPLEEISSAPAAPPGPAASTRTSPRRGSRRSSTSRRLEALSEQQRELLLRKLGDRASTAVAQDARSQARNRELALERLREKLAAGPEAPEAAPPDEAVARRPRAPAASRSAGDRSEGSSAGRRPATTDHSQTVSAGTAPARRVFAAGRMARPVRRLDRSRRSLDADRLPLSSSG